jgi:hypothetical protein
MWISPFLLLSNESIGFTPHDPCTLFHPSSICAETGRCVDLSPESSEFFPMTCRQAYVSLAVSEPTNNTDPPLIIPISNDQLRDQIERQIFVSRGNSVFEPPLITNSTTIEMFSRMLAGLSEKMKSEFPWLVYSHQDDAQSLRGMVQMSGTIRRSWSPTELDSFQFYFAQQSSVRSISGFLRATIASVYTISDMDQRRALIGHTIPFFHMWLSVLSNFKYPTMFLDSRDFGFYSFLSQYDPLYPSGECDKLWILGISETVLERHEEQLRIQPMVESDDFPLGILDRLGDGSIHRFVEDRIRSINETLTSGDDFRSSIEDLAAALLYMHHYETVSDEMRVEFCNATRSNWLVLFETISEPRHVPTETFGNLNLLELFRICGKQYLSISERTLYVLPAIAGVRCMDYAHARYVLSDLHDPDTFWIPRVVDVIDSIPIYHIRKWVLILFDDDLQSNTQSIEYFALLTELINRLTSPENKVSLFEYSEEGGELVPMQNASSKSLTVFGSAVAITLIHGDPFGVLLNLFGLNKTDNFYFNSVSVRAGFCLVVNCIVFDELFDKFELSEMIQLVRESHVLARTSIA